jgi:SAM-dependent methyltransferase
MFSFLTDWSRRPDLEILRRIRLKKNMTVLDVGSGQGHLVGDLREMGYKAYGIDPDLFSEVQDKFGVRVERKSLSEITQTFDVILFRHSLERLPIDTLRLARERISENGCCVACIALLGWAWRTYATDWAQLNLPRNHVLHSIKSFSLLAEKSGFRIEKVVFDSTEFQFWASDALQRDIPLHEIPEPNRAQRARMRRVVESLNLQQQGDTAQFYLKPI